MIIATAGHVDHGKTTLLEALTGVDTAHLPEEKRRGMTIDLGYAYFPLPNGQILGFIDVPGHEKFLSNMLAGVGGVQHALLVVACDDGVMAQTREHLTILSLLGTPALTVALTKSDKVDSERVAEVEQQIRAELEGLGWRDVPLFITSAPQGIGIEALRAHLSSLPHTLAGVERRFRLAIDRVFTIKGAGLVVTGTAFSGSVNVGDTLWLTGLDQAVRVRGIHSQNHTVEQAKAGERVALNLSGNIEKQQISRGDWLLSQQPPEPVERVLAIIEGNCPLLHWQSVHLHHAASHVTGRISLLKEGKYQPGQPTLVELVFDKPLYLTENDRIIIRDVSAKQTLAGGRVLVLDPPKRGKRQPEFLAWLAQQEGVKDDEGAMALRLPKGSLSLPAFSWARQLTDEGLNNVIARFNLVIADNAALDENCALRFQERLLAAMAKEHELHPDQLGIGRARLRRMALPAESEALVFTLIDRLLSQGELANTRGWLHLPHHAMAFDSAQETLWQRAIDYFKDDPWWVRDLANELGVEEEIARALLRKAAQLGLVTAIVRDRYFLNSRISQFAGLIREMHLTQGRTNAADFRDRLGVGRKLAIQVLEFFDRSGFTRRRGNDHLLRDSGLFSD